MKDLVAENDLTTQQLAYLTAELATSPCKSRVLREATLFLLVRAFQLTNERGQIRMHGAKTALLATASHRAPEVISRILRDDQNSGLKAILAANPNPENNGILQALEMHLAIHMEKSKTHSEPSL